MVALAGYFEEMVNGFAQPAPAALPEADSSTATDPCTDEFVAFRDAALLVPSLSVDIIEHLVSALRGNGAITHGDRLGRKADWIAAIKALVEAGLLEKSRKGYDAVFTIPSAKCEFEVPEREENSNV